MSEIDVANAARNNAAWCDAVCSAHGRRGEFFDSHWLSRTPTPPYHPNLVTLDASSKPAMAAVRELDRARPSASWAVKDSFGVLPLEPAGFRVLFEAEWIFRPARLERPRRPSPVDRWFRVRSEPALAEWEAAWGESLGQARIFLPALLRRSEVAILAARDADGVLGAGVIAHRSEGVVGVSNLFTRREASGFLRAECIGAAVDAFPGLPLVGYEAGRALAESRALGFRSLGTLRVWMRETGSGASAAGRAARPRSDGRRR